MPPTVPPSLLSVEDGRFRSVYDPDALLPPSAGVPEELPARLPPASETTDGAGDTGSSDLAPVTIFLTVDVEDAYFTRPHMMTGDQLGEEYGAYGILDLLDEHGLHGTFFVNAYEAHRHPPGTVERLVRAMADRGHEPALHTHPAPDLELYSKPLFRCTTEEQKAILAHGKDFLERSAGQSVVSFRAGGYALNDDTFEALEETGVAIDSSCFFPSPNNQITRFTVNAVRAAGTIVEVPVTYVVRHMGDGELAHRKLDWDWLTESELDGAIETLWRRRCRFAVFMMHSFSFIEKATRMPSDPPSDRALFRSGELFGRYVEIYGVKPDARAAFGRFLARLKADPRVRVRTMKDALSDLRAEASRDAPEVVPVVQLA